MQQSGGCLIASIVTQMQHTKLENGNGIMIIFDHEKPESTGSAQESAEVQTHCALCGREFSEHAAH